MFEWPWSSRGRRNSRAAAVVGDRTVDEFALEYRTIRRQRRRSVVHVDQPLVLISQIQRSGGTLLSQLFDAHPELHAHPYELKIGFPRKEDWPDLDLDARPDQWYKLLVERRLRLLFDDGYSKTSSSPQALRDAEDTFPFLLPPKFQRKLFVELASAPASSQRDVLDTYMTSFFNAWLDNQNLYARPKKWVTGFTPRTVMVQPSVERFFRDYPDGRLVGMVRRPHDWYASARLHNPAEYEAVDAAMRLWRESADAIVHVKETHGSNAVVVTYESLVTETEAVMRRFADLLEISYLPSLLEPTFNGIPIRADSSFASTQRTGIVRDAGRGVQLPGAVRARIDEIAGEAYARVAAHGLLVSSPAAP